MSIYQIAATVLTGPTDAAWVTVDLDSFVAVPSGAVAAIITVENTTGTNRTAGLRTTGKTTPIANWVCLARTPGTFVVPLGAGNQVDLYAELASALQFSVNGFLSSAWTILDIDSATTIAGNAAVLTSTTVGAAPANATVLTLNLNGRWRPTGESDTLGQLGNIIAGSASTPNTSFVKLNASQQFDVACTTAITVLGYATAGVNWASWLTAAELTDSLTKGAWTAGPSTFTGKSFVYLAQREYSSARGFSTRAAGDGYPALAGGISNAGTFGRLTALSSGAYEYIAENVLQSNTYAALTFDAGTPTVPTVTDAGDETLENDEPGIVITGTNFGSVQGTGTVLISPTDDVTDSAAVAQQVTAWSDTSITVRSVKGSLPYGAAYLFVNRDGGGSNAAGYAISFITLGPRRFMSLGIG